MEKYTKTIRIIRKDFEGRKTALDDVYVMGECHAIQSIVINDYTIDHKTAKEIYTQCQAIIDEIIGKI